MLRILAGVFGLMVFAAAPAGAQEIERFFGHFEGSGISENADSIFFAVSVRDLDVKIRPAEGGGVQPELDHSHPRRRRPEQSQDQEEGQATLIFLPTDKPGVFRATEAGDPLRGEPVWWSRVEENTLYTYRMQINLDGTWQVQKYVRTVSGSGMTLVFERIMDGDQTRQVRGRLIKVGN